MAAIVLSQQNCCEFNYSQLAQEAGGAKLYICEKRKGGGR